MYLILGYVLYRLSLLFTDRVTVYREAYVKFFIADLAFWLDWLADAPSCELYEKALTNFPHFELANKYVEFASSLVEEEKLVSDV